MNPSIRDSNGSGRNPSLKGREMAKPDAQTLADMLLDPRRLEELDQQERAYRRGVDHAFNLAGDLVRRGATADDLDILSDLATDWRYGARPDVHLPEELIALWRRGERGITGIDPRALGITREGAR